MIERLEQLINIPSVTGDENAFAVHLEHSLRSEGYRTERQDVDRDRFNLLATLAHRPRVLLSTHMDTVAPHFPARRQGEVMYGRGACDAKGAIVAMIEAGRRLRRRRISHFGYLFVVGEESHSDGAKKAARMPLGSEYVIIGEPTENRLAVGQKGSLVFCLRARGVAGHSAYPERGDSAIHRLVQVLDRWLRTDWGESDRLGRSTLNIGVIKGGDGSNVIASEAEARGIFRVASSVNEIRERALSSLGERVELEVLSSSEPQQLKALPGFEQTIVSFGSDAAHLRPLGEILLCGPGSVLCAHSEGEMISSAELETAADTYVRLVEILLREGEKERT